MATKKYLYQSLSLDGDEGETNVMLELMISTHFKTTYKSALQKSAVFRIVKRKGDVLASFSNELERKICYFVPAVVFSPKLTIVFSSNITKIKEHSRTLNSFNIKNAFLSPQSSNLERTSILKDLRSTTPTISILFMTIEQARLVQPLFAYLLKMKKVAFIVVDESNAELEWIFGEKKEYKILGHLRNQSTDIPWVVLTSVADFEAINNIKMTLNLITPSDGFLRFTAPCFRFNIFYDIIFIDEIENPNTNLVEFINKCLVENNAETKRLHEPRGVIYCKTAVETVTLSKMLSNRGIKIAPYNDSLSEVSRIGMRLAFVKGRYQVIAVTEVDGMNINKVNLKFVIHWGLPSGLTAYYQQCAEAGKGGSQVRCRIYLQNKSLLEYNHRNHKLIDTAMIRSTSREEFESAQKLMKMFFLAREMAEYCASTECRHSLIGKHFGDIKIDCYDRCDNCVKENNIDDKHIGLPSKCQQYMLKEIKKIGMHTCMQNIISTFKTIVRVHKILNADHVNIIRNICEELISICRLEYVGSEIQLTRCNCPMKKDPHYHPLGRKEREEA